jgi:hypothetical protein
MNIPELRTWIIFYLISFVVLLVALLITQGGELLWISLTLVIVVVGINFITLSGELKKHTARKDRMKKLSCSGEASSHRKPATKRW